MNKKILIGLLIGYICVGCVALGIAVAGKQADANKAVEFEPESEALYPSDIRGGAPEPTETEMESETDYIEEPLINLTDEGNEEPEINEPEAVEPQDIESEDIESEDVELNDAEAEDTDEPEEITYIGTYVVNRKGGVNMRINGKDTKVIHVLKKGAKGNVISIDGSWVKMEFKGDIGYIFEDYIDITLDESNEE